MPDWDTRLTVTYDDGSGEQEIFPIDSFAPNMTLNAEPLHSCGETHVGVVYAPQSVSFQIIVKAIGDVAARLTALALNGTRFSIVMKEKIGDDWSFKNVVMTECIITSAVASSATISGAPTATFSGFSLGAGIESKSGAKARVP